MKKIALAYQSWYLRLTGNHHIFFWHRWKNANFGIVLFMITFYFLFFSITWYDITIRKKQQQKIAVIVIDHIVWQWMVIWDSWHKWDFLQKNQIIYSTLCSNYKLCIRGRWSKKAMRHVANFIAHDNFWVVNN